MLDITLCLLAVARQITWTVFKSDSNRPISFKNRIEGEESGVVEDKEGERERIE